MVRFSMATGWLFLSVLAWMTTVANAQQYPRQAYRPQQQTQQQYRTQQQYGTQQQRYGTQQQYRTQPGTAERTYSTSTDEYGRTQTMGADHKIALWMANCNKGEIRLGRYARDRAESSDVREFADSLVQDHDLILRELERFAPEVASDSSDSSRNGNENSQRRQRDSRFVRAWDDATVSRQIADRIVRKARDELSEKEGIEFDRCFVTGQLVSHQQSLAQMEVLRQYASGELRQVIDEAIEIVEGHEEEARDLAKELKRQDDESDESSHRVSSRERYDRDEDDDYRDNDRHSSDRDRDSEDEDRGSDRD